MTHYSILDLIPISEGSTAKTAIKNSVRLAQYADQSGFTRYWLAEHHNMPGVASSATAVLIGHIAAATNRIRVGSGGVMLPNHAPLVVAEQFGTLETIYNGRIDLGLGRAPGTDPLTARALRRSMNNQGEHFPDDVVELMGYLAQASGNSVRAVPGEGTEVPIWILGSSLYGAQLAAYLGLPFAFASHFAPDSLEQAVEIYQTTFKPSRQLDKPYFACSINIFASDTDEEATFIKTSHQQGFANVITGKPNFLPKPVEDITAKLEPGLLASVNHALRFAATGGPERIHTELSKLIAKHKPDEVIFNSPIHNAENRLKSFDIARQAIITI
ncbi:LLM class flavin-dependent oxidoreductase [Kiloniella sp.]|uniref:LLM class flavin-dependent oxidoreductase n=1 Tax=Kiloniella sp. TaxID=1938587 RepID=UPI003B0113E4